MAKSGAKTTDEPDRAEGPDSDDDLGAASDPNTDVAQLSYEQARDELVDIVGRLESGQVGLEESMGLWQRGEALAAHCASWLDQAEARLGGAETQDSAAARDNAAARDDDPSGPADNE